VKINNPFDTGYLERLFSYKEKQESLLTSLCIENVKKYFLSAFHTWSLFSEGIETINVCNMATS